MFKKPSTSDSIAPEKNKNDKLTMKVFVISTFILSLVFGLHTGWVMFKYPGCSQIQYLGYASKSINNGLFSFKLTKYTLSSIFKYLCVSGFASLALYVNLERNRKDSKAQGTAQQSTNLKEYNEKFVDSDPLNNMILTDSVSLSMDSRKTRRNNNILVIGGSGSGKTRFMIKPNILQANVSFVITDPKGEILESEGEMLRKYGYQIKVFNLTDMKHSNSYNPFQYIRDDLGVLMLVNCLIKNTNNGQKGGDPFWEKSETTLLEALIFYTRESEETPPEKKNFTQVLELLNMAQVDENNPDKPSELDLRFQKFEKKHPTSPAVSAYKTFKLGAGKTLKSILISAAVRLQTFNLQDVANLTMQDNLELKAMGDRKTALFVVIPAADDTYNFLVSMMYSQLFETLYYRAENECKDEYWIKSGNDILAIVGKNARGDKQTKHDAINLQKSIVLSSPGVTRFGYKITLRKQNFERVFKSLDELSAFKNKVKSASIIKGSIRLPIPVRFLLDEFANIGEIPNFTKKLATMRQYEISCTVILQNLAQIKTMYKDDWESIVGNCDSFLFLGGQEQSTLEFVSKLLGKETVIGGGRSMSVGKGGANASFNQVGKEMMSMDQLATMPKDKCILIINGLHPFQCYKYKLERHPHFADSGDANKDHLFDYKREIQNIGTIKAEKEKKKFSLSDMQGSNKYFPEPKRGSDVLNADMHKVVLNVNSETVNEKENKEGDAYNVYDNTDVYSL